MANAKDFEGMLLTLLEENADANPEDEDDDTTFQRITTFEDEGMLTHDRGLVVRCVGGDEFQLTIVRSKRGKNSRDEGEEEN